MTFEATLSRIADGCDATAVVLMGADGIPIAQVAGSSASEDAVDELTILGVEFGRILDDMRKAAGAVDAGPVQEVSVHLTAGWLLLRSVDPETTLVLMLADDGNHGKARFLMRRHLQELREQL